jgi:hypothetical protein
MAAFRCPHCEYQANFARQWKEPTTDAFAPYVAACFTCDQCGKPVAALVNEWGGILQYWPTKVGGKEFPDVPPSIAASASEAHICIAADAPRGAVALARAVVESVAKDNAIIKGNLATKIDKLFEAGFISEAMKEAAHEIRFAGNEAAHGELVVEPISVEDADEIVSLMDAILERVYQEPARVARIRAKREERSKKAEAKEIAAGDGFSDDLPF